jgi:hypothetical protein
MWSLQSLGDGLFPAARHDGQPFSELDKGRALLAGKKLPLRAACLWIKGDWAEFCITFGLPSWADSVRPCYMCNAHGANLYTVPGNSTDGLRWESNVDSAYEAACQRCLRRVVVGTEALRGSIASQLRYDKRLGGSLGRCAGIAVSTLGIEAGDRLEPSDEVPDVGCFETTPVPFVCFFLEAF